MNYEVGDLVTLSYDQFRIYGYGIVLGRHQYGEWEVYWFLDQCIHLETSLDIQPATMPEQS